MRKLLAIAILILLAGYGAAARAADAIGESIEWLVIFRPHIAIEDVTSVSPTRDLKTGNAELTIQTHLKEVLKGQPPAQATFVRRWQETVAGEGDTAQPGVGTEYLLFFDKIGNITNAINLKSPSQKLGVGVVASDVAVSSDFKILKSGDVIMDTIRHILAALPKDAAANPPVSRQVEIPMDSPAWDVFYDGKGSDLLVPQNLPGEGHEEPVMRTAVFSGLALMQECHMLPKKFFEIKSAMSSEPHTLVMKCVHSHDNPYDEEMLYLIFQIKDVAREADYDFRWMTNPDAKDGRPYFTDENQSSEDDCETVARMLRVRALDNQTVPLKSMDETTGSSGLMAATATAQCVTNAGGTFGIMFELKSRYPSKDQFKNAPVDPSAPASEPASPPAQ